MARQCLVAAILHQLETEFSASVKGGSQQSKTLVLPINGPAEEAKCEDLEEIVVGDDLEKFFSGWGSTASLEKGRANRVSQEER